MSVREAETRARELLASSAALRKSSASTQDPLLKMLTHLSRALDRLEMIGGGGGGEVYSPRDYEDLLDLNEFQAGRGEDLIGAIREEMERLTVERDKRTRAEKSSNGAAA